MRAILAAVLGAAFGYFLALWVTKPDRDCK